MHISYCVPGTQGMGKSWNGNNKIQCRFVNDITHVLQPTTCSEIEGDDESAVQPIRSVSRALRYDPGLTR